METTEKTTNIKKKGALHMPNIRPGVKAEGQIGDGMKDLVKRLNNGEFNNEWNKIVELAQQGYCLYPVHLNEHEETLADGTTITKVDKRPAIKEWQKNATNDITQLWNWFKPDKNNHVIYNGVAMIPKKSNVVVIDLDDHDGKQQFRKWIQYHESKGEMLTNQTAACEKTAGNGLHFFFLNDENLDIKDGMHLAAGVELKVNSTTIYPSENYTIPNANGYKPLAKATLKPMPDWLKNEIKQALNAKNMPYKASENKVSNNRISNNERAANWLIELMDSLIDGIPNGERNNTLTSIVGKLFAAYGDDTQKVIDTAAKINEKYCEKPLKDDELKAIVRSVSSYSEHGTIKVDPLNTESSTAAQAAKWMNDHKDVNKLPYNVAADIMLKNYHFIKFSEDEGERVAVYVSDRRSSKYGLYVHNYDYLKRLINSMNKTYSRNDLTEVIEKIALEVRAIREPDNNRYLIPVGNGVFNLKTKALEDYTPERIFSTKVATKYNDKFKVSTNIPKLDGWDVDTWLKDVSSDENGKPDNQVLKALWQVIADAINGNYSHNIAPLLYSPQGNSGKGTFQQLIVNLVGTQNVAALKIADFSGRFAMSNLLNKSVCIGDDNSNILIKDNSNFNSVVTGDPVSVEFKGKDAFYSKMNCTVIQSMNEMPHFTNKDGVYRRILIIPFRRHFGFTEDVDQKENRDIKTTFLKDRNVLEYVLYKALNEYADFEVYDEPAVSKLLKDDFKEQNDPVQDFYNNVFKQWDFTKIPTQTLYIAYRNYCEDSGVYALGRNKFVEAFINVSTGYHKDRCRIVGSEIAELKNKKTGEYGELFNEYHIPAANTTTTCIVKTGTIK